MDLQMFATWVLVGLLTGWVAGFVMKDGGYGLVWDLVLGLIGSSAASGLSSVLAASSGAGMFATAFVAFAGAAVVIVTQRKVWYARA